MNGKKEHVEDGEQSASLDNAGERGRNERWRRDGEGEQTSTCTLTTHGSLSSPFLPPTVFFSFSSRGPNVHTLVHTYPRVSDYTWAVC